MNYKLTINDETGEAIDVFIFNRDKNNFLNINHVFDQILICLSSTSIESFYDGIIYELEKTNRFVSPLFSTHKYVSKFICFEIVMQLKPFEERWDLQYPDGRRLRGLTIKEIQAISRDIIKDGHEQDFLESFKIYLNGLEADFMFLEAFE